MDIMITKYANSSKCDSDNWICKQFSHIESKIDYTIAIFIIRSRIVNCYRSRTCSCCIRSKLLLCCWHIAITLCDFSWSTSEKRESEFSLFITCCPSIYSYIKIIYNGTWNLDNNNLSWRKLINARSSWKSSCSPCFKIIS